MAKNKKRKEHAQNAPPQLYGKHSVKAAVLRRPRDVTRIVLAGKEEYHRELIELARHHQIEAELVTWPEFLKIGKFKGEDSHQGVLAFAAPRRIYTEEDFDRLQTARCIVVLDQVSNPQNFATIIRSAAFFHADAVLYMRHRSATPTAEVVRFAVGGAEFIDFYCVTNVAQTLEELQIMGFAALGLDERGQHSLSEIDMSKQVAFVVGAEGEGLRQKTREHCTELVRIPGGRNGLESLNAGVATTIALYENGRGRLKSGPA